MKKKKALSIALSSEELYVVLAYLNVKKPADSSNKSLMSADKQYTDSILETAEKGLLARGYLFPESDGKLKPIPPLLASVGTCAFPETSILIKRNIPERPGQEFYFHIYRRMLVFHTIPMTDIHQFTAVENKKMALDTIISFLSYKKRKLEKYSPGVINTNDLLAIRDHIHEKDASSGSQLLIKKGFDEKTAEAFARSLSKPLTNTNIAHVTKPGKTSEVYTILESEKNIWLLQFGNGSDQQVSLSSISSNEINNKVQALINL